jgi:hypothetical protein
MDVGRQPGIKTNKGWKKVIFPKGWKKINKGSKKMGAFLYV